MNTTTSSAEFEYQVPQSPRAIAPDYLTNAYRGQMDAGLTDSNRFVQEAITLAGPRHEVDMYDIDQQRAELFGGNVIGVTRAPMQEIRGFDPTNVGELTHQSRLIAYWRECEQIPIASPTPATNRGDYDLAA